MRKFKKLYLLSSVIMPLLFFGCKKESTVTKIGIIKVMSGLPTFVAYENGIFEDHNLSIELKSFKTSDLTFEALINDEIDVVGVGGLAQALKLNDLSPNKFLIIGILDSSPCLIVSHNSNIQNLEDLANKTIGVFPGSIFGYYAKESLDLAGVDVSKIKFLPLSPPLQLNELNNKNIDALFSLEPQCISGAESGQSRYLSKDNLFSQYLLKGEPFPGGVVAVSKSYFEKNRRNVDELIEAYQEATEIIKNTKFNAVPYLDKYTSIDSKILERISPTNAYFGNQIITQRLNMFQQNLNKWEILQSEVDFSELIYEP